MLRLEFDRGTLLIHGQAEPLLPGCEWDERVLAQRTPACRYRDLVNYLRQREVLVQDDARGYETPGLRSRLIREPFPYQKEAVTAWRDAGRRGVVVLPTGAGKTFVAEMAIEATDRSALIVTPTLDLMQQWYGVLSTHFETEVGTLGGGSYEIKPLTVTTYDSAWMHMDRLGNRFALLVFDECHHLPGPSYSFAAEASIAPFRLGLTATPEREDGLEGRLERLIGPLVFRQEIKELAGEYLADYETVEIRVTLSEEEGEEYAEERAIYRDFISRSGIRMGSPQGWTQFLIAASQSTEGRRAFLAYRNQRRIVHGSSAKLRFLETLFQRHRHDRVIVFTNDNETVHRISREFLVPSITHQTKVKERHEILLRFNEGLYPFLVTSKVLNEGVDVPSANVGVVLSGSGSVREHVQRLGRILRRGEGKRAILYEVVAEGTGEEFTSTRRRRHDAYR